MDNIVDTLMDTSRRVLYALDFNKKNGSVINEARLKFFPSDTVFHIVTVIPRVHDATGILRDVIDECNEERLNMSRSTLRNLVEPLRSEYRLQTAVIIDNSTSNAIKEYVEQHRIDCVILNGRKHGFWGRYISGEQERIINVLDCDVIIAKKSC
ncbi:universal stress protein [Caedibacter taeniospiralis]|uniref:universal stress protein n=1 Tax=Caedibacter taeniospiralis TaxID=28907 RepID=UPI0013029F1A|nr:universal stress protein [Caedibacter taeniospiralis]